MKKLIPQSGSPPPSGGSSQLAPPCALLNKQYTFEKTTITIEETIAEGGFGVVFLARDNSNGAKVACKRLLVNNEDDLVVANREVHIMTHLRHPHILGATGVYRNEKGGVTEICILMPYCKGSLLSILKSTLAASGPTATITQNSNSTTPPFKTLPMSQILVVASHVTSGLSRLHFCATPLIHRDMKVENILEDEGRFLICDFGSATAKIWDPDVHGVQAVQEDLDKFTTLAYRAPEMTDLYSKRGPIGPKADIWALGVLLYKTAFFSLPFGDSSILAVQSANLSFPTWSPYPAELHALIWYCLTRETKNRPDIFQVAHIIHTMQGVANPVSNLNNTEPISVEQLVQRYKEWLSQPKHDDSIRETRREPKPIVPQQTTVTPRQRPRGLAAMSAATPESSLLPPPKSPSARTRSPHGEIPVENPSKPRKPSPPPPVAKESPPAPDSPPPPVKNWNPFEETSTTKKSTVGQDNSDDVFANAPFAPPYKDLFGSVSFSNPFLDFGDDSSSRVKPTSEEATVAVCNVNTGCSIKKSKKTGILNPSFDD